MLTINLPSFVMNVPPCFSSCFRGFILVFDLNKLYPSFEISLKVKVKAKIEIIQLPNLPALQLPNSLAYTNGWRGVIMDGFQISIIGAGKVGTAVGHLLKKKGYTVSAVACRTEESLKKALPYTGGLGLLDPVAAAKLGNLIFVTTSDKDIEAVCQEVAANGGFKKEDIVFHMSGALSVDVLRSAREKGAKTGCLHPMQTFATVRGAIKNLPGSVFGITVESDLLPLAKKVVGALGGKTALIKDEDKPLYHAAAVIVCNYLVSLFYAGQELYKQMGISPDTARRAFLPLLKGTLANLKSVGAPAALTGPISRGDTETIKCHLEALGKVLPDETELYRVLGRYTIKVALAKGTIDKQVQKELCQLFLDRLKTEVFIDNRLLRV